MAGPDKQQAEPQPLSESEREPEGTLSPKRKLRLFLAARWMFVGLGAAYMLLEVVEVFWLGAHFTHEDAGELALASFLVPILGWIISKCGESATRSYDTLFHSLHDQAFGDRDRIGFVSASGAKAGEYSRGTEAVGSRFPMAMARADRLECGQLVVDFAARRVTCNGEPAHLTPIEYGVLDLLARHAGQVLRSNEILSRVWGEAYANETRILRTHIGRLRNKIESDPRNPALIITEWGVGYRLDCYPRQGPSLPISTTSRLLRSCRTNVRQFVTPL